MKSKAYDVNEGRRNALKKIAVGVGCLAGCAVLPEQWTRPIVGQIVLPAHAATSGTVLTQCTLTMAFGTYNQGTASINFRLDASVTPPIAGVPIHIVFSLEGVVGTFTDNGVTAADGTYSSGYGPNNGPGYTRVTAVVTSTVATGTTTCILNVPVPLAP